MVINELKIYKSYLMNDLEIMLHQTKIVEAINRFDFFFVDHLLKSLGTMAMELLQSLALVCWLHFSSINWF